MKTSNKLFSVLNTVISRLKKPLYNKLRPDFLRRTIVTLIEQYEGNNRIKEPASKMWASYRQDVTVS